MINKQSENVKFADLTRYGNMLYDQSYDLEVGYLRITVYEYEGIKYLVEAINGIRCIKEL